MRDKVLDRIMVSIFAVCSVVFAGLCGLVLLGVAGALIA